MKFTDNRIKLMNEVLNGIKILKFYAWEEAFLRRVGILRDGELSALRKSQILYSVSLASFNSSSFLVGFTPACLINVNFQRDCVCLSCLNCYLTLLTIHGRNFNILIALNCHCDCLYPKRIISSIFFLNLILYSILFYYIFLFYYFEEKVTIL